MNYEFGNIELADGSFVRLTQQAYANDQGWEASGYLSTENEEEETGPTVRVSWDSLGAEESEDDADWDNPSSIYHYNRGDLVAA
jgi:hypothetical protein